VSFALAKTAGIGPSGDVSCGIVVRPFAAARGNTDGGVGWHVRPNGVKMTVRIYRDEEGLWWARGWKTKEADALRTMVALS